MLDYVVADLSLRAVVTVEGTASSTVISVQDIVHFQSSFAINTIPTAILSLAVGTAPDGTPASIHRLTSVISSTSKVIVTVYLKSKVIDALAINAAGNAVAPGTNQTGVMMDGELLIFSGRLAGIGRAITSSGTAAATLHIEHWLANLNYASAISASSHPDNPADIVFPAVWRAQGGPNTTSTGIQQARAPGAWVPTVSSSFINQASLTDIWGNILHKWILELTTADPFARDIQNGLAAGDLAPIIDAVNRLKPANVNPDSVPLAIDLMDIADSAVLIDGIKTALNAESNTNWVNNTIWSKIIGEWAPSYWFAVIPRITDALIVPTPGGLSGEAWSVIGAEDYSVGRIDAGIPQRLRGVGIVVPAISQTGLNLSPVDVNIQYLGFSGQFIASDVPTGMLMIKNPPVWLSSPIPHAGGADLAEGAGATDTVQTTVDGVPAAAPSGVINNASIQARINTTRNILSKYAHQWYVHQALKDRTGEIAGKVRFDIAPGSLILLKTERNSGLNAQLQSIPALLNDTYAHVMQVSYVFDVENSRASTAFTITHSRTAVEQASSTSLTVGKPPLYAESAIWRGARMVASDAATELQPEV